MAIFIIASISTFVNIDSKNFLLPHREQEIELFIFYINRNVWCTDIHIVMPVKCIYYFTFAILIPSSPTAEVISYILLKTLSLSPFLTNDIFALITPSPYSQNDTIAE